MRDSLLIESALILCYLLLVFATYVFFPQYFFVRVSVLIDSEDQKGQFPDGGVHQ
jgi:hypothetical protein